MIASETRREDDRLPQRILMPSCRRSLSELLSSGADHRPPQSQSTTTIPTRKLGPSLQQILAWPMLQMGPVEE